MNAGGCPIHVVEEGTGDPVLFVHGFPLSGAMWQGTVERLRDRCRCIVPDLRGHGRSESSPEITIEGHADDLAVVLDALRERRPAVVVGLSMGGAVALEFFRRHRSRSRALVLADTRAGAETREGKSRREALARAVLEKGSRAAADVLIDPLFAEGAPGGLKRAWREVIERTDPAGIAANSRALARRPDPTGILPTIDVPVLVVAGELDAITPAETLRTIHDSIPGSRFAIIPGAGHLPPVEQPEAFAAALRGFLESLPRGGRGHPS